MVRKDALNNILIICMKPYVGLGLFSPLFYAILLWCFIRKNGEI